MNSFSELYLDSSKRYATHQFQDAYTFVPTQKSVVSLASTEISRSKKPRTISSSRASSISEINSVTKTSVTYSYVWLTYTELFLFIFHKECVFLLWESLNVKSSICLYNTFVIMKPKVLLIIIRASWNNGIFFLLMATQLQATSKSCLSFQLWHDRTYLLH